MAQNFLQAILAIGRSEVAPLIKDVNLMAGPQEDPSRKPSHHHNGQERMNEVDKVIPNYGERKEWLRRNGAGLDVLK